MFGVNLSNGKYVVEGENLPVGRQEELAGVPTIRKGFHV
jgi:hypothetical protein